MQNTKRTLSALFLAGVMAFGSLGIGAKPAQADGTGAAIIGAIVGYGLYKAGKNDRYNDRYDYRRHDRYDYRRDDRYRRDDCDDRYDNRYDNRGAYRDGYRDGYGDRGRDSYGRGDYRDNWRRDSNRGGYSRRW